MKCFSLVAAVALVAVSVSTAHADETMLLATADNSTATEAPIFIPGVGTPSGLGSDAGSLGEDAPMTVGPAKTGSDDSGSSMASTPAGTPKKTSVPTPSPSSGAQQLVGASVAISVAVAALL